MLARRARPVLGKGKRKVGAARMRRCGAERAACAGPEAAPCLVHSLARPAGRLLAQPGPGCGPAAGWAPPPATPRCRGRVARRSAHSWSVPGRLVQELRSAAACERSSSCCMLRLPADCELPQHHRAALIADRSLQARAHSQLPQPALTASHRPAQGHSPVRDRCYRSTRSPGVSQR